RHFVVAQQGDDQGLLDGHARPEEEVRRAREKTILGLDLHFRVLGEITCATMDVGLSLPLFPKLLHGMPRADALVALRADALEVRRPMHAVFCSEQSHAELLVCQSAQRPAVLFLVLDGAMRKVGDEILVLDLPADAIGLFDSQRVSSGRRAHDYENCRNPFHAVLSYLYL